MTPRTYARGFSYPDDWDELDAASTPGAIRSSSPCDRSSSPALSVHESEPDLTGLLLSEAADVEDDDDDPDYILEESGSNDSKRASPESLDEKVLDILGYISKRHPRLSVKGFMHGIFVSKNPKVKQFSSVFMAKGSFVGIMNDWWNWYGVRLPHEKMVDWVVDKACHLVNKEGSWLTDRASEGPHYDDAKFLRVNKSAVTVDTLKAFSYEDLTARYARITPWFQRIMRAFTSFGSSGRDTQNGLTFVTSVALNLRSHLSNYHQIINGMVLWDNQVPKRIIQMFNQLAVSCSYPFLTHAIQSISHSAIELAKAAAFDFRKFKILPYDNFNWLARAWETSALHKTVTHDQVSALLLVPPLKPGEDARTVTALSRFKELETKRHDLHPRKSLLDIVPGSEDQSELQKDIGILVQQVLVDEIKQISHLKPVIPKMEDPDTIPAQKTEEYYLPTLDQEQSSTRGNMAVLTTYFGKVLGLPMKEFETTAYGILGDRLTTSRDRAAQDQRAIDRSSHAFDHLSSFKPLGGLMHYQLNFIKAFASVHWGSNSSPSPVSLSAFQSVLPNRSEINVRQVNYYAWQRFIDTISRGLILQAALVTVNVPTIEVLGDRIFQDPSRLQTIATSVTDNFILAPPSRLEANGVKRIKGSTESGNAVLLLRDIMTLRVMRDAVKRGHPTRIVRVIKYWAPMFYAAGSYNYANECMETLHCFIHDWPSDFAEASKAGLVVNPHGKEEDCKETDIRVEHLNDKIKERAIGSNATPAMLAKITPAMGYSQDLTDKIFREVGVEKINQTHTHVKQHKDVLIVLQHIQAHNIFHFAHDKSSSHIIPDLYRRGLEQLSGPQGAHARHLERHKLRLRERHDVRVDEELGSAQDAQPSSFTVGSETLVADETADDVEEQGTDV